eukprot:SAG11_NODE_5584_length_1517_cov_2.247532_1_plen_48_part_10
MRGCLLHSVHCQPTGTEQLLVGVCVWGGGGGGGGGVFFGVGAPPYSGG